MEKAILASLTKKGPKTRPTNIKIPKAAKTDTKSECFAPAISDGMSLFDQLVKCTLTESDIAEIILKIDTMSVVVDNADYKMCEKFLSDIGVGINKFPQFYHLLLVLKLPITKPFMVNELIAKKLDLGAILQTIYLLLLLKLDDETAANKYSEFLIVKHDNLLTWTEVLMEA
jgi:hypothetical protein